MRTWLHVSYLQIGGREASRPSITVGNRSVEAAGNTDTGPQNREDAGCKTIYTMLAEGWTKHLETSSTDSSPEEREDNVIALV
jgi:hypothetical protein